MYAQASFDEYFAEMPWHALPYPVRDIQQRLSQNYGVSGLPTLVVLDAEANLITVDGRSRLDEFLTASTCALSDQNTASTDNEESSVCRFPGKILRVQDGGMFTVEYTDGKIEENVSKKRIHPLGASESMGGVFFLDEAYDLDPQSNSEGKSILAELMYVAEEHRDTVTIVLAG